MAIRTLRVNASGDLDLSGGRAHWLEGTSATPQLITSYLRTIRGEWYLARKTMGVPYWEEVLVHSPNVAFVETVFVRAIAERPGVRRVESIELELVDRALRVTYVANTKDGPINASTTIAPL